MLGFADQFPRDLQCWSIIECHVDAMGLDPQLIHTNNSVKTNGETIRREATWN